MGQKLSALSGRNGRKAGGVTHSCQLGERCEKVAGGSAWLLSTACMLSLLLVLIVRGHTIPSQTQRMNPSIKSEVCDLLDSSDARQHTIDRRLVRYD